MSNVPNHQKGQSLFHQTALNADEDELVNQSEIALVHWSPFVSLTTFAQTALIGQEVCQEISQLPTYWGYFLWNVCLILIFTSKRLRGFPHCAPEPTSKLQDKSEIYGTKLCVAQGDTPTMQWHQCCVHRHLGLWVLALWGYFVNCWKEMWHEPAEAADRWGFEYDMTRCSFSTGAGLELTGVSVSSFVSPHSASRVILQRRSRTVGTCPRQCAVSGKVEKQKLSVLLPSGCRCRSLVTDTFRWLSHWEA